LGLIYWIRPETVSFWFSGKFLLVSIPRKESKQRRKLSGFVTLKRRKVRIDVNTPKINWEGEASGGWKRAYKDLAQKKGQ
jgi:hypothetical protein